MKKAITILACVLAVGFTPARAEVLQVDLSIFGMD
jgi:hypothetical protein